MSTRSRAHETLRLAVDLVILTVREERMQVLLIERANDPFRGQFALPGGFLRVDEDPSAAALRELKEETGLDGRKLHLVQLPVFGELDRDPRGRVVSVPFLAIVADPPIPSAGSDARAVVWKPVDAALADGLAFDHAKIIEAARERARRELEYTTVAAAFCGDVFTIGDLRRVYEVMWGDELDPGNFSRKVTKTEGFIIPTEDKRAAGIGRPAVLYRRGPAQRLHPPMLRTASDRLLA